MNSPTQNEVIQLNEQKEQLLTELGKIEYNRYTLAKQRTGANRQIKKLMKDSDNPDNHSKIVSWTEKLATISKKVTSVNKVRTDLSSRLARIDLTLERLPEYVDPDA